MWLAVAGLLRPEIWPFLVGYGAWTWRLGSRALVAGGAVVIVVAWFGPDVVWSAGAISAGDTARAGQPGERRPRRAPSVAGARRRRHRCRHRRLRRGGLRGVAPAPARMLALLAVAYAALVAVATFAVPGNPRYLVPAIAVLAVLAGVGAAALPWPRVGVAALLVLTFVAHAGDLRTAARDVAARSDAREGLDEAIRLSGGAARLRACGPVRTVFLTRASWRCARARRCPDRAPGAGPGTTLLPPPRRSSRSRTGPASGARRSGVRGAAGGWSVWSSCR